MAVIGPPGSGVSGGSETGPPGVEGGKSGTGGWYGGSIGVSGIVGSGETA